MDRRVKSKAAKPSEGKAPESEGKAPAGDGRKRYLVLSRISLSKKNERGQTISTDFLPGQEIELTDATAKILLGRGTIAPAKGHGRSEEE